MRTAKLGAHGPELSVIGFGAWEAGLAREWGEAPPEEQVIDAIEKVLETGINWIDTAEVYGNGTSETLVGRALAGDVELDEATLKELERIVALGPSFD